MGFAIVLALGLIGFAVMSRPFRIVALLGTVGFGLAVLEVRWHVGIVPRDLYHLVRGVFQGDSGLLLWFALYGSFTGLMGLGVLLGVVRRVSSTHERYAQRRKAIWLFLAQWGGMFMVFRGGVVWVIDQGMGNSFGMLVVHRLTVPVTIAFTLLVVSFKWWWVGRLGGKQATPAVVLERTHEH